MGFFFFPIITFCMCSFDLLSEMRFKDSQLTLQMIINTYTIQYNYVSTSCDHFTAFASKVDFTPM